MAEELERWLPLLSLPGYDASSKGRVRTGRRIITSRLDATGTHVINAKHRGAYSTYRVARLVAEVFCRGCEPGKRVKFLDGNHTNYTPTNLKWVNPNEAR
jgi:hypothetical protein